MMLMVYLSVVEAKEGFGRMRLATEDPPAITEDTPQDPPTG